MKKTVLAVFLLFFLIIDFAFAQSFYANRRERNLIATVGLSSSTYLGDLKDDSDIFDAKPSISLGAMYYFYPRIAARAEFSWVTMAGDDADTEGRQALNLSFTSSNFELSATGVVSLFPNGQRFYQRPKVNPYGFVGIGLLYFNPKAELNGTKYALQPLKTEGVEYSRLAFVIPYGLGARFNVSPLFNVALEAGWRKTFTDYLDDVSDVYVDNASFTDPIAAALADRGPEIGRPLRPAGSIRGNPDNNDSYILYTVKVEYYLPYEIFAREGQRKLYNRKRKAIYRKR